MIIGHAWSPTHVREWLVSPLPDLIRCEGHSEDRCAPRAAPQGGQPRHQQLSALLRRRRRWGDGSAECERHKAVAAPHARVDSVPNRSALSALPASPHVKLFGSRLDRVIYAVLVDH